MEELAVCCDEAKTELEYPTGGRISFANAGKEQARGAPSYSVGGAGLYLLGFAKHHCTDTTQHKTLPACLLSPTQHNNTYHLYPC